MTDKSGIDMIEELLEEVRLLHKKVDLLDRNLKEVANSAKLADLITRATGTKLDGFARAAGKAKIVDAKEEVKRVKDKAQKMQFKFEPADASKIKQPGALANKGPRVIAPGTTKKVVVKGKLVTMLGEQSVPLSQIDVQVVDDKDKVIKNTKTNRAGHWISHLPPGRYVATFTGEYGGKKLTPINKKFEVPEGVDEFEVQ